MFFGRARVLVMYLAVFACHGFAQLTVYVSPGGSDTNPGTVDLPYKTVGRGLTAVGTNGSVILRGGVYLMGSSKLSLNKIGQQGSTIKLWAYPGESPVLDCTGNTSDGISISGSYYHLKGLEQRYAGHNGINISGSNNIIENCVVHDNRNTGLHLTGSAAPGPSNNLILNCDTYMNYDPPVGGNADGFSAKWTVGPGNVFRGCRAWNNSDDGWDLWMGTGTVLIDSCYAFRNGVDSWFSGSFNGNGNGFKLGGNYIATPQIVRNSLAFDNAGNGGKGFDENNNTGGQTLYNCTSFRNQGNNYSFRNTVVAGQTHIFKNCVSVSGGVSISSGTQEKNSWQGFTVTAADFLSLDTAGVTASRNPDGSLPPSLFLRLAQGSAMIDAGANVGLPFSGGAPDLGAFETSVVTGVRGENHESDEFMLAQNFPNPFNPRTAISYQLLANSFVNLRTYDVLGREVAVLVEGVRGPGSHTVHWNASSMPSGVYILSLQVSDGVLGTKQYYVATKKMVLLK